MDYQQAKAKRNEIEAECRKSSEKMDQYPRSSIGLVNDEIRQSAEFQEDRKTHGKNFARLRQFNAWFVKTFKEEIRAERTIR